MLRRSIAVRSTDFYPRPPRGGRPAATWRAGTTETFLSTPSVGRATCQGTGVCARLGISIHALRGEGDDEVGTAYTDRADFYPRPPWGGRLFRGCARVKVKVFLSAPSVGRATTNIALARELCVISIRALRGEGDDCASVALPAASYFYPRPPWGGRQADAIKKYRALDISIRALRGEGDSSGEE